MPHLDKSGFAMTICKMETLYISQKDWTVFIKGKLKEQNIFAPFPAEDASLHYGKVTAENLEDVVYCKVRTVAPPKIFFSPFKEKTLPEITDIPDTVVMGPVSCDLQGLKILDKVFAEGDYKDTNYLERRKKTLIISFDCQSPFSTCFCEIVDVHPYPEQNFDLNLSFIEDGFIVEVGSEKGKKFIEKSASFFQSSQEQIEKREKNRVEAVKKVKEANREFDFSDVSEKIKGLYETERWKEIKDIENCVQCGSCTANCPSCVCFLLEDTGSKESFKKTKVWDSCLFPGYAKMAAGATPRPSLYDRYANRLLCKYWYMVENFELKGCTGCGRCIAGCIGKIDKRKVLTEVLRKKVL